MLARIKHHLRRTPFDSSTREGRAQERYRQILLTTLSSATAKISAAVISFALIPLSLSYLGTERFGLWVTISAAVGMLGIADLGVGSGLMNVVATAHGKGDIREIREKIALGILLLGTITLSILILFAILAPILPWVRLINVSGELASKETVPTISIMVVFFALSIPAGIVFKVQMGLQMGFVANLWLAVSNILGLAAAMTVMSVGGGLPYFAAATVSPPVIIGVLASLYFWTIDKPSYRPKFIELRFAEIKGLASTSGLFLVLQISGLIAFQSDNLIIAHYLGPESVAVYAVAFKLFALPSTIIGLFLNALWPAYAEAKSRGDKDWVYATFFKSLRYSSRIALPLSLMLLLGGKWIIETWVGPSVKPTWTLLVGLFFWSVLTVLGGNFAMLLNGLGVIKFQVLTGLAMAGANIAMSVWLVQRIGVAGVAWGSVLSLALVLYLPTVVYLRKHLR